MDSAALATLRATLREGQKPLGLWRGGPLAVSAVPGSGKSHSLSVAAALTIAQERLTPRRSLLVVTFTRAAAAAIKSKVKQRLGALDYPGWGFNVQTLHGLALNLATRYPAQSGLDLENSALITPQRNHRLLRQATENWLQKHPRAYEDLLTMGNFDGEETERLRRQSALRTEILPNLLHTTVREGKSSGLSPEALLDWAHRGGSEILTYSAELYGEYEALLKQNNFYDYDDMILGALRVLEDESLRRQWQGQYFAVFEDEAQDSSPLQESLITQLARRPDQNEVNLIRVGDPNQAINSTFTPADPVYFNRFCQTCEDRGLLTTLDQAGRSAPVIIQAANLLLAWVNEQWPHRPGTADLPAPFRFQEIRPVDADDPQPNPPPEGKGLELAEPEDIYQSVEIIGRRLIQLLTARPDHSAAILVRENRQGRFLVQQLGETLADQGIRLYSVSDSDRQSEIPRDILQLLQFSERPHSPQNLKAALEVLQGRRLIPAQDLNRLLTYPEDFLYPSPLAAPLTAPQQVAQRYCRSILRAKRELSPSQLIPFLGLALQYDGAALATLHKLQERLQSQTQGRGALRELLEILGEIVAAENFEPALEEEEDLYTRPGQVAVITMHKAKGLDWDYVFIPFLQADLIPGKPWVPGGAKFLGDYTLGEVARAQIRQISAISYQLSDTRYQLSAKRDQDRGEGVLANPALAWREAEHLQWAEEFRLLYVAMTRAKRLLWLGAEKQAPFWGTFQAGRSPLKEKPPCPVWETLKQKFPRNVDRC
ncbi:MAG: AAA family ATPase [Cyanobacteria bacterium RI_101]|nr:AAA family ATPase [Cyanobacteria bacterium RI_101]